MQNLAGATIDEITRDIRTGEFVLKSHGDIKGNLHAQTVIIYGNVSGDIHANEVLVMGGKVTGRIIADTVACIEDKKLQEKKEEEKKKDCSTCKYITLARPLYDGSWVCLATDSEKRRMNLKICKNYKEENPAKQVSSPKIPIKNWY